MIQKMYCQSALLLGLLLISSTVFSQKKYELTVKQAVEIAFENLMEVKNAALDVEIQQAQNEEIKGQVLPQISSTASLNHYLSLPQIQFPDGTIVTFVQPWSTTVGASLSQLLFQPDVFVGLQARKTALGLSRANLEVVKEKVKDSAYRRYYAILIAQKQSEFLQTGIKRLQKLYHDDSIMYVNGFAEKLDLDKVQVQMTNLTTSKIVLDNSIKIAYSALKYSIGVSQYDTVILREELTTEGVKTKLLADNFKYEDRKEIQALQFAKDLEALDVKRKKLGALPTLSAFVNYGAQGQGKKFITDNNTLWFRSSLVGMNFSLPLFDGFQRRNRVQQARLNLRKIENNIDNLKQVIDLQQSISKESLKSALLNLDAQERNVILAENVYNSTKKKFENGLGSSFEVLQADNDWQTAQSNYFSVLYNAILAKISYQSSLGKLE